MIACKNCRYYLGRDICKGVKIRVSYLPRFNPIEGVIEYPVEYKNASCSVLNHQGNCKAFEEKPTVRKDGLIETIFYWAFSAGIYEHKQEIEERRNP